MQKEPSSSLDREISLERKGTITISSEGSSFTQKESPQYPLEASPPNTKDIKRCSVKKNRRGYLNTPFGIMPSNCSQEHLLHYQDDSSPSHKAKLPRHRSS